MRDNDRNRTIAQIKAALRRRSGKALKPATHPPCCDECDGKTGENVDPDYYCAAGTPWLHHADLAIVDGISGENAITDAQAAALARLARPCDLDADERGAIDDETGQRLR